MRRLIFVPSLVSVVLACGPGQDPRLETEHLTFHGELDGVCEAFGVLYEREVDRIEHELGRGLREPVDVHIGRAEVGRWCPAGTSERYQSLAGCVVSDTEVASTPHALSLQLVQVTREQYGVRGIPFIEKVLPYMFGLGRPSAGHIATVVNPSDPDYDIASQLLYGWSDESLVSTGLASHFLHWVQQAYGPQAFEAWLWSDGVREGRDVAEAFAEATGQTIAVAQRRWGDESESDIVFGGFCHGMPAPPLSAEGLLVEASACCDAPGVEQHAPPLLNVGSQCFTLPADIEVTVEMLAGEGTLVLRPDGCLASPSSPLLVELGEAATVTMTACRWIAMVMGPERCEEGDEVRYAITPS
jgi:hypothetical protein